MNRRHFIRLALAAPAAPALAAGQPPVILVLGDSLSAEYGIARGSGWVALLQQKLATEKIAAQVVNASISGDTSSGGRARLPALLNKHHPAVVVIELGGNDALRGGRLAATRENLDAMVTLVQRAKAKVLLVGMQMPSNYGPAYVREFNEVFTTVAKTHKVPLVPFFFEGFGEDMAYFQSDRIHPTAEAQPRLLDNVWPALKPLLAR